MATKRMFTQKITKSGKFLMMPPSTQALYFHLCMDADDDGIVEAYPVMKLAACTQDDLRVLHAKKFVRVLNEEFITHIVDWNLHNTIRSDRKIDSIYKNLLVEMNPEDVVIEASLASDGQMSDIWQTDDGQVTDKSPHRYRSRFSSSSRLRKKNIKKKNEEQTPSPLRKELEELNAFWNKTFNANRKSVLALESNYAYWREEYSLEEMKNAARQYAQYGSLYWAKNVDMVFFLRTKDRSGNPCDHIGDLLQLENEAAKQSLSEKYANFH